VVFGSASLLGDGVRERGVVGGRESVAVGVDHDFTIYCDADPVGRYSSEAVSVPGQRGFRCLSVV